MVRHGGHDPGCAQAEQCRARGEAHAQGGRGVVPRSGAQRDGVPAARRVSVADGVPRPGDAGQDDPAGRLLVDAEGVGQDVPAVLVARAVHIARARGIGAIGHQAFETHCLETARDPPGEVVVGQADGGDPRRVLRLVVSQPA